ncbi:MAG: globin family protein [Ktedonobacteraceae bacterium]
MDVQVLKRSFDQVVPQKEAFAKAFYQRLFREFPETAPLFAKTDMARQESSLIATLAVVVNGLAQGGDVVPAVKALGKRHKGYHVEPEHFDAVGQSLLATLSEYLGAAWTPEVEANWVEAYTTLATVMKAEIAAAV